MKQIILLGILATISLTLTAQKPTYHKARVNIFVVSRLNTGKIDFTASYVKIRAAINAAHAPNKFILVVAGSADEAARKIERKLKRKHQLIGSIWFDSHGHYADRYSSFAIGISKFSHLNIQDSGTTAPLARIARFCDRYTNIALGACYAGAAYAFPATDSTAPQPMFGDSLLRGLGQIFTDASIYGSQSWVMAKPGMFTTKYGLVGNLIQKRYKDKVFEPVWERLGSWNSFSSFTNELKAVSTVAINRWGDIKTGEQNYGDTQRAQKKIAQKKAQLEPGIANFK